MTEVKAFKLSDTFIEPYKTKKAPFGFGVLGELTFFRTYSRIKEDGTNEKWFEVVRRVVEGTYSIQKKWIKENGLGWDNKKAQKSAQEMYDRIFNMKFLPPGRGLWVMGTPIINERGLYAALNNCFDGETEFITDNGIVRFMDVVGEQVNVLTSDGTFKPALVNKFGTQKINKITMKPAGLRSNLEQVFYATENHRWILSDGKVVTELRVGDMVQTRSVRGDENSIEYKTGFTHGLIFGDGSRHTHYPERHFIKVCDGNHELYNEIAKQIDGYQGISYGSADGYPVITVVRKGENWKQLPLNNNKDYIAGFIVGWLSADSWHKPGGTRCLDTQNLEAAEWLIKNAPYAGYIATGHVVDNSDTNFGKRKAPLQRISLSPVNVHYKVTNIEFDREDEVYCVTEPETSTFVLAGGILTGNCAFVSTKNLKEDLTKPFEFLMDMSMLGVGVGFDVKGAGQIVIQTPSNYNTNTPNPYVIPDSREGWVESVKLLLRAFFVGEALPDFDYSQIRKEGEPIKGFGGVSSGPQPLIELHSKLTEILEANIGQPISITVITDIMNLIGKAVVAGNVRRTAEIVFGPADNPEYLDLKNYKVNPQREEFGWTSNNSVFATLGMNYKEVADRIKINGEPGVAWLSNMQNYSRMLEQEDYLDFRVMGGNPCLEQSLEPYELCCLVETFPANHDSIEDYLRTLKFAYLYAKTVTLGKTHWPETNRVMLRNRRIGTSMSGIAQFIQKHRINELKEWCEQGYAKIEYYDAVYSEWFAIPRSIKKTSVKPSGTVSLLAGATPGLHYPESRFYIRRVRLSKHSDLIGPLIIAGYHIEPAFGSEDTTVVVEIPVDVGEGIRTVSEVSMWEQLSLAAFMQKYWADNQVSCTVTFNPETEGDQIEHALNYFQYQLKGISFLPKVEKGVYKQMPYEEITEERYNELMKNIIPISFNDIMGEDAVGEKYCSNDSCQL